ncbi:MAG TPA: GAF domain-containing protein [Chloroflexia bacterium]|nr:GAF domain-containing protein [Chloroflexia bacterium]
MQETTSKVEERLRQIEEQYYGVFQATTDGLVINDLEGHVVEVNPEFCAMHGYTREEMIAMDPTGFVHPDSHEQLRQFFETVARGEQFYCEAMDVRKDGTPFHVEVYGTSFMYKGEPHILGVVRDITERAHARELLEQRVEERTRELATLLDVSSNMASMLELEPLLNEILDQLKLVADYTNAAISIIEGDELRYLQFRGPAYGASALDEPAIQVEPDEPVWRSLLRGEPVLIADIRGDTQEAAAWRKGAGDESPAGLEHVRSWLGVPLTLKQQVIGMLSLSHDQPDYYTPRHVKLATAVANQAAVAIENARLYEEAQETNRRTATLATVASRVALGGSLQSTLDDLCRSVVEATGAVAAAVAVIKEDTGLQHMTGTCNLPEGYPEALNAVLDEGTLMLAQPAFEGRRAALIRGMRDKVLSAPDYARLHEFMRMVEWDTILAVPMIYRGQSMGVLLGYYLPERKLSAGELGLCMAIADQAAVAVENARLVKQAQGKAALEERQRLARELHDSVTQELFSISLTARSIQMLLERSGNLTDSVRDKMLDLRNLTQGALAEMRALIFELRPGALEEEGLLQAIRKHAAAVQGREMMQIDVVTGEGGIPRLKPAAEEALYRVVQEALHNVVKHARASSVTVSLAVEDGGLVVRVTDDGLGFDPGAVPVGHMGLDTMRQRVAALSGDYNVDSAPGRGTTVQVRVPLDE